MVYDIEFYFIFFDIVLIESFRNWVCWLMEFPSISFFLKKKDYLKDN